LSGVAIAILQTAALAQTPRAVDQTAIIQRLMDRVEQLEKRVNDLESEKRAALAAPTTPIAGSKSGVEPAASSRA
jgi:cell division protein FtsB